MLALILAFLFICITAFFLLSGSSKKVTNKSKPAKKEKSDKSSQNKKPEQKKIQPEPEKPKSNDNNKYLFKTIKEDKDMTHCYFYNNGHFILFCNSKKVYLCYLKNINCKTQKILSKNIERDSINDVSFSPNTKIIVCAAKNSKSIIFYEITKIDGKIKLNKLENKLISTQRPYEINSIVMSENGDMISTSGTNDDTEIQIYDSKTLEKIFTQSTGGIHNFQILMGPNDNDLLISTFMNDISVINFNKSDKFNSTTLKYETVFKIQRNPSISGIKSKLLFYCMSNDEKFFGISTEDKNIKIFRNYGNISDSKLFSQFSINYTANIISLYIIDFDSGRLNGLVAASNGRNIYLYDENGKQILELDEAHDSEIIGLNICKVDLKEVENGGDNEIPELIDSEKEKKNGEYCLISASKDGRIKFWKNWKLN